MPVVEALHDIWQVQKYMGKLTALDIVRGVGPGPVGRPRNGFTIDRVERRVLSTDTGIWWGGRTQGQKQMSNHARLWRGPFD